MIRQTVLRFKLEKTGEELTAHAGLALLSEYHQGLGLRELARRHLPAPGSNRGYGASAFVESLVLMLPAGGRRLEDVRELRQEGALLRLWQGEKVPDADTMGDWLRRMGEPKNNQAGLNGLGTIRDTVNQRILKGDDDDDYTLDVDATQVEAEKAEAKYTYQGVKGYMPMLGFLFEPALCLYDEFREGNQSPAAGQVAFYRQCQERMPAGKRIARYRADSASYQAELVNALEEDKVQWTITADQDAAVKDIIRNIPEEEWQEPRPGCGYQLAEAVHSMEKTKAAFRLLIKRELRKQRDLFDQGIYHHYAVATNWPREEKDAQAALTWHNQRGQAENFNKELKSGFGQEQMPCRESHANAVYFRLGVLSYNLFIGFKRLGALKSWAHHTIATFRWKLLQTAGRIVRHAGRVILKLAVDDDKFKLFERIRQSCYEDCRAT